MNDFKAAGIIGYKKSGKTSLLVSLARELTARHYTVSSVKHVSCDLDLPETDTALHRKFAYQAAAISPVESAIFFQESISLEEMLNFIRADIVLLEGFKNEKTYPKIVCLRPGDDPGLLLDGLEICLVGDEHIAMDAPFLDPVKDISRIADLVEEKAFKLPNLNCGACGYKSCYELACQIVKAVKSVKDCRILNSDVQIKIDGRIIPLKPFVSEMVRNTILGMLSSLKGYHKGVIEIKLGDKS